MKRIIGEWVWRVAMVCALGWIGMELHGLRQALTQLVDDDPSATAEADDDNGPGCVDAVRQRLKGSAAQVAAATWERRSSR